MRSLTIISLILILTAAPLLAQEFGSISGVVTDQNGEPLNEARIIMTAAGQVPLRAETGEDGLFAFEEAGAVEWNLIVSARGYFNFRDDVVVEADQELELEIALQPIREEVETGSISGMVTDQNGEPLNEARIIMTAAGQVPLRAVTGEDGLFAFEEAGAVEWNLIVSARGYFNFRDDVVVEADQELELEIALQPIREEVETGSMSGVITDQNGEPLNEARIIMTAAGQVPLRAETGEDGLFAFEEAGAVEWNLIVSARGYFNFRDDVVLEADQELELEIALQPIREEVEMGSISGVVTDQNGEPLNEARVIMTAAGQVPLRAVTGEDGLFAFEEAGAVEWNLIVSARGYFNFRDDVVVEADQELELEIALQPIREEVETGSISGVVTDQNGEPLNEARIIMTAAGQIPLRAVTGEDGLFAFEEAGAVEWNLIVSARGYFNFRDDVVVEADQELELEITLQPIREEVETGSISGVVTDQNGEPLNEARIIMTAAGQVPLRAETGEDGLFAFEEAGAVEWNLIVSARGYFNFRDDVVVEADQEFELEIALEPVREGEGVGGVWGRVAHIWPQLDNLESEPGTPVEFELFAADPDESWLQYLWTVDGDSVCDESWVSIDFNSAGRYTVTVYVSDYVETESLTWIVQVTPNSVQVDELLHPNTPMLNPPVPNPFNSTTTISYYLPEYTHISMSMFDAQGRLIASLIDGYRSAGRRTVRIDGSDLKSGVYFVRMTTDETAITQKILYMK